MAKMPAEAIELLQQEIRATFMALPYPGDDQLIWAGSNDGLEIRQTRAAFAGLGHWSRVSPRFVHEHALASAHLGPEAFRFFSPGIMLAILDDFSAADFGVDTFVNSFAIIDEDARGPLEQRLRNFSFAELLVIRHFLEYLIEKHGDRVFNATAKLAMDNIDRRLRSLGSTDNSQN